LEYTGAAASEPRIAFGNIGRRADYAVVLRAGSDHVVGQSKLRMIEDVEKLGA
jgi:hypothetical protein